jgi:hypothetical protein
VKSFSIDSRSAIRSRFDFHVSWRADVAASMRGGACTPIARHARAAAAGAVRNIRCRKKITVRPADYGERSID